jgi:MYXO-CTERM domain-containing protein
MNRTVTLVTCLAMFGFIATAEAHFHLNSPAASLVQDSGGNPQKTEPCGGAGTATNAVTPVQSGAMLSISITETISHAGYYRVFLAQNMAGLPKDPLATATDASCNGLVPVSNPTLPMLADGLLMHTTLNPATQTMQVPIPAGMTCTNCVLQVVEYMQNHPYSCYYHHCATVNISPNAPPIDAPNASDDAGIDPGGGGGGGDTGCCSTSRGSSTTALLGVLVVGMLLRRRRC